MAGTYVSTGTYSNLTRLELEQLRRADFEAGGKALTVGDSALPPEGVVGPGNVQAEPFYSGPALNLDDVYSITPPSSPGPGLTTKTTLGALISETVRWWGPTGVYDSYLSGFATAAATWQDNTLPINFIVLGVQPGDILCIKPSIGASENNASTVATITVVAANTLTVTDIWNPGLGSSAFDFGAGDLFSYIILRPQAVQLFAVPGSGPKGHEQTYMMVGPGAGLHNTLNPSLAAINAQRIQNVVRPQESLNDRADLIFDLGTPRSVLQASLDTLGYRVVLYPSNALGTGPDYAQPITKLNPVIDPAIPAADQRMTIDYRAGVVRFSCAPQLGGDIKVAGGVNATTGRVQLYAVFWSVDQSLTRGNARGVYVPRSSDFKSFTAGKIRFNDSDATVNNSVYKGFQIGATSTGADAYIKALGGPETQISSSTFYPFLLPWKRASTEFGTTEVTSGAAARGLRYFSYRQASHQWRFNTATSLFFPEFGYTDSEMVVADKTEFTVSDAGGPANFAGNMNPYNTFGGSDRGIRSHGDAGLMNTLHTQLARTPYGTVHLKRGRYYIQNAIMVPPGTTIEGEGSATRLIYRNFSSTVGSAVSSVAGLLKVGPNTTWGVYDASSFPSPSAWMGTDISPTLTDLAAFEKIEGMDTVWNPVRRVWAVVYGSLTTHGVYFNEIREDGSKVFPGIGVNIKDNLTPLFGSLSTGGQWHSGGHSPRLAYSEHANEYTVCWVEEHTVGFNSGGKVAYRQFQMHTNSSQEGWEVIFSDVTLYPATTNDFSDHPSIAVENFSSSDYFVCLVYWTYSYAFSSPTASRIDRRYIQNGSVVAATSSTTGIPVSGIVSSTSVEADAAGGFMAVWSIRTHRLLLDSGGTITVGPTSYLTDGTYPGWGGVGVGVQVGSKVHILVSPTSPTVQQGLSGVVTSIAGNQLFIKREGAANFTAEAGVTWAVSPSSVIRGRRIRQVAGVIVEAVADVEVVAATVTTGNYQMEMREPDYVRISRGTNNWCVVFQGFNTHCGPAYPRFKNFDNGVTNSGPTWSGSAFPGGDIPSADISAVYREHVSTCAVILRDDGQQIYPTQKIVFPTGGTGVLTDTANLQFPSRISRDLEVSLKSLGGRTPITERPNYQFGFRIPYNYARDVSFLNFAYRWTMAGVEACIPDVTWTGQDWVAVSPTKNSIHSFTGDYQVNGGNSWFTDPLFYFGEDAPGTNNFGWILRKTIPTGAAIYVPVQAGVPVALTLPIVSVADEHTVNLAGHPLGAFALTGKEWFLLLPNYPVAAGAKNQGFRIGSDGHLIASTDFITWADQPGDMSDIPREVELMRRPQTRGGNYPSQVAGTLTGESADRLQPTSRYKANIGFRGVAPGRPKGIGRRTLGESPMVAIAWGENLYGLIDRTAADEASPANHIEFFRQTFGPYNVTLRNFSLEATPSSSVEVLSKAHVYTRHLAPTASVLSFDTDGFRNVFVYPTSRIYSPYGLISLPPETSLIGAVYTDAKGYNPIYVDGPTLGRSDLSSWSADIAYENVFSTPPRYIAPGVGPKVIWDGQRFAIFWVERANQTTLLVGATDAAVGYYLCMSYLPGAEDGHMQTGELVDPYEAAGVSFGGTMSQFPLASVHISDGTGFSGELPTPSPTPNQNNTVAVCEVAFSGKVYAVVWTAGMVPNYAANTPVMRGSTIGVTLFNMDAAASSGQFPFSNPGANFGGGGTNYIIDQSAEPGTYQNPKIIWDGSRFVIFYETVLPTDTAVPPSLASAIFFTTMPEDGGARPAPVRQMSNPLLQTGANYDTVYPGTAGPFATTTLGSLGLHSLGYAVQFGQFATATAPFYQAFYTVIQLFGNQVSPFVATGATGVTTAATPSFTDGLATFLSRGVRPGDYLLVTSGADAGVYMIETVTPGNIDISASSGLFVTGTVGVNYAVVRYQQPNVQPGDLLVVNRVMNTGTLVSTVRSNGVYPVINYDPRRHQLIVQGLFDGLDISAIGGTAIYGEIRGGGMSDYDNASSLESTKAGVTTRGAIPQNAGWAGGISMNTEIFHGVAYNDVDDEFAILATSGSSTLTVSGFKPSVRASTPAVLLNYSPTEAPLFRGDIAWNGSHYLVVMPMIRPTGVLLQAKLLNTRFGQVGETTLHPNTLDQTNPTFLFGNALGQIPGPGYGAYPTGYGVKGTTPGPVTPFVSQMKVKWNPRLSRWLVAASVLWYDCDSALPGVYPSSGVFLSGPSTIVSWVGRTLNVSAFTQSWQPGMKIVLAAGSTLKAAVTILSLVGPGPTYDTFLVDAAATDIPSFLVGDFVFAVVREDVLCWTVGQSATGLIVEDADNVHVENVVVGGGATDIEESWPNMGRPVWQAAGQTWGAPANVTYANLGSQTRQPQYNHRFMTPAGKVNLPTYTNVTSAGHHPYGRKTQPGAAYVRDKLRNRMGGG